MEEAITFPQRAVRIWHPQPERRTFVRFRMKAVCDAFQVAELRVSAIHYYELYVNGHPVTRLFHRYFHYEKQVQSFDVTAYLHPGENVVALQCYGEEEYGLMAELLVDGTVTAFTQEGTLCAACTAYNRQAPDYALLFAIEEQYDARLDDAGWELPAYDDSGWERALPEQNPIFSWSGFNLSDTCDLTWEPVYAKGITALLLARDRDCRRFRLDAYGVTAYATEMISDQPVSLTILTADCLHHQEHHTATLHIDGIAHPLDGVPIRLAAGRHLLLFVVFGNVDVLLEADQPFTLCADAFASGSGSFAFAPLNIPWLRYPWHESVEEITSQRPLLQTVQTCSTVEELAAAVPVPFGAIADRDPGALFHVMSQKLLKGRGCFADPRIAVAPTEAALECRGAEHLLRDTGREFVLEDTGGCDAHFILDLGREYIGYIDLDVTAAAGTVIDVQFFELIDHLGCLYIDMHNGFRYTCREGRQAYISPYRRGGRYLSVTVRHMSGPVRFRRLRLLHNAAPVVHYGTFECGDAALNDAYTMSYDTAEVCMLDTYVDCPGHEQNFWVGDARITALINLLNFGGYTFNQHCIRMVGQSMSMEFPARFAPGSEEFASGKFLAMSAFGGMPRNSSIPMWSYLWILQCHDHYRYSGSLKDLRENYGYVCLNLTRSELFLNARGLMEYPGAWNLIDWAANDLSPYGEVTANNILLAYCYMLAADMATALGREDEARIHRDKAAALRRAINTYCWNESKRAYVDTVRDETAFESYCAFCRQNEEEPMDYERYLSLSRVSELTNCMAVLYDAVPPERLESVDAYLERAKQCRYHFSAPSERSVGEPKEGELIDGMVAVGTPFALYFVLDALFKTGRSADALHIMRKNWGDMRRNGVNTCCETFQPEEGHITRSIAHAWSASPAVFLPEQVLGVRPIEPGYAAFWVDPCESDIPWAKGSVMTPYGPIYVHWEYRDGVHHLVECTYPQECRPVFGSSVVLDKQA